MARYEWTTEKGNKVTIEVEKVTFTETAFADGWNVPVEKTEKRVTRMAVNGAEVQDPRFGYVRSGEITFWLGGRKGTAILPKEISGSIWAEENAAIDRRAKVEDERAKRIWGEEHEEE